MEVCQKFCEDPIFARIEIRRKFRNGKLALALLLFSFFGFCAKINFLERDVISFKYILNKFYFAE